MYGCEYVHPDIQACVGGWVGGQIYLDITIFHMDTLWIYKCRL